MLDEQISPPAEPTIPADIKAELTRAAKTVAELPKSSTLSSGESVLPTAGTPARSAVQGLGLDVHVNHENATPLGRKIEPVIIVKTGK